MATDTLSLDFGRDKPFYVYLYRDPRPKRHNHPIYIGKGTSSRDRANDHWLGRSNTNRFFLAVLAKIRLASLVPDIEIVAWFDEEDDAFHLEKALIAKIGRRNLGKGPLLNLTDGGEGTSGRVVSDEERETHRMMWVNASPEKLAAMGKSLELWNDPVHAASRKASMKAARAREIEDGIRWELHKAKISATKQTPEYRAAASDKQTAFKQSLTPEQEAEIGKNISDAKVAQKDQIAVTSSEVWNRPGMRAVISAAISVGQTADWEGNEERHETARLNAKAQFDDPVKAERHRQACIARDAKDGGLAARYADPVQKAQIMAKRKATREANIAAKKTAADKASEEDKLL